MWHNKGRSIECRMSYVAVTRREMLNKTPGVTLLLKGENKQSKQIIACQIFDIRLLNNLNHW